MGTASLVQPSPLVSLPPTNSDDSQMKWGLIARSETDRGIGIQTLAISQAIYPDKTLVVIDQKSGFQPHPGNYPGASIVHLKHGPVKNTLPEAEIRDWWKGLDVVFTVETFYDWDLISWAKADGVRTVVQGNPEFWQATNPQPDVWTWPTRWRLDHLPSGPIIPVPTISRPNVAAPVDMPTLKVLHIAGNRAMGDRNGTDLVSGAMRRMPAGTKVTVFSQAPLAPIRGVFNRAPAADRWNMYVGQHILLLPRRYGGLCLPALEAMACGLAVMMPQCEPNEDWPIYGLQGETGRTLRMQTGEVKTFDTYINDIGNALKHVNNDRSALRYAMESARTWAEENTWARWASTYYDLLDNANRLSR